MSTSEMPEGRDHGAFEIWAPAARRVEVRVDGTVHAMRRGEDDWFDLPGLPARPGARYAFRLDGSEQWLPDPRSLFQPDGVHADSEVVDPRLLPRTPWEGRSFRGGVIYELHVGTFAPGPDGSGGTLDTAIGRLDHLVALGVDAIELMPLAAFPGARGWGYDGVDLYAVHEAYGGPAALARFVEAAHGRGLAVVLDVVLNHLGPAGNYLSPFGPYFTEHHETPWGWAVNLDDEGCEGARAFLRGCARHWLVDMGLDGLRLDAVHELRDDSPRHFLAELADAVSDWETETGRPLTLIAESDRNDPITVTPTGRGGLGMDMQWADDVHHAIHAWISGERQGYYVDFGSAEVLARTLTRVLEHAGTFSTFRDRIWGAPVDPDSSAYDAHSFVAFLENHDQVGNRARGDRVHQHLTPGAQAAAIALILLGAPVPMLFQGEEWACSTPFQYFTDHDEELGRLVTAGRREEFAAMGWDEADVPDPQALRTFTDSFLDWDERESAEHAEMLAWHRRLIALRREHPELRDPSLSDVRVDILGQETIILRRGRIRILVSRAEGPVDWQPAAPADLLASFGALRTDGPGGDVLGLEGAGVIIAR